MFLKYDVSFVSEVKFAENVENVENMSSDEFIPRKRKFNEEVNGPEKK